MSAYRAVYVSGITCTDAIEYSPFYNTIDEAFDNLQHARHTVYEVYVGLNVDNATTVRDRDDR